MVITVLVHHPTNGFRTVSPGNRPKSRSAVHSSRTPSGLNRTSSKPAARRRSGGSPLSALVASAGVVREGPSPLRMARNVCGPSSPGMRWSMSRRSKRLEFAQARAARPSPAVVTVCPPVLIAAAKNSRLKGLSSATRTWPTGGNSISSAVPRIIRKGREVNRSDAAASLLPCAARNGASVARKVNARFRSRD